MRSLIVALLIACVCAVPFPTEDEMRAAGFDRFEERSLLQKFVNSRNCNGDDICIIRAVGDYLKQRVNVMDCAFSDGVVGMCKRVESVGRYKGCTLWAVFKGKDLPSDEQRLPSCTGCTCTKYTRGGPNYNLQTIQETKSVQSLKWMDFWGKLGKKKYTPNTGDQKEHLALLSSLSDYWNAVIQMNAGVCASLATSLAFGSRLMGVKGSLTWISETYPMRDENGDYTRTQGSMVGHEFLVYNLTGSATNPTGGVIADAWYHLLTPTSELFAPNSRGSGYNFSAPLDANVWYSSRMNTRLPLATFQDTGFESYDTSNWKIKDWYGQRAILQPLDAPPPTQGFFGGSPRGGPRGGPRSGYRRRKKY